MAVLKVFQLTSIVCFVGVASACRANVMEIKVTKNKIAPLENQLTVSSKEVTVAIKVDAMIPASSNDSVTIDALTCRDNNWNTLVMKNLNFFLQNKGSIANNTVYWFISTIKLITPKVTSETWQWVCELSTHWGGCNCNVVHSFSVKVDINHPNEWNDSRDKIPSNEYQGPAEPKQLTCGTKEIKDMDRIRIALHAGIISSIQQTNSEKKHLEHTETSFSDRNSIESKSRYGNGKTQMPTDKIKGMNGDVEPVSSSQDVNNSSSLVVCIEATTSTTWLIFSVASVIFLVGLVTGVFCRRRPRTREPEQNHRDEQTDEHIYDDVDAKGINNRPPLPVPEQDVYIYNSPYDHTLRFQNQKRLV